MRRHELSAEALAATAEAIPPDMSDAQDVELSLNPFKRNQQVRAILGAMGTTNHVKIFGLPFLAGRRDLEFHVEAHAMLTGQAGRGRVEELGRLAGELDMSLDKVVGELRRLGEE